ncbi:MAG TPA: hypothetical protein DCE56_20605 [Cyanobacteria bacterium UBA8553]|nr:hypothetical protein [Cyanobacteria bacterium UBA8553]HAJ61978.1 hypothetical protein [Cyanobacteria bacterium UBA8543]
MLLPLMGSVCPGAPSEEDAMTTPPPTKNSTSANSKKRDDLTRLKEISSVQKQWLRKSLKIHTFRELAALSADEIENRLRAEGQTVSKSEIEGWIVQARELVALEERSQQLIVDPKTELEESLDPPTQESKLAQAVVESADIQVEENITSSGEEDGWRTFASFLVEFQSRQIDGQVEEQQTTIRHLEANTVQTWSGIESERLNPWIICQVDAAKPRSPEAPPEAQRSRVSPVKVAIDQLRIWQPPQTEMPMVVDTASGLFSGMIRSDQPLALEVGFRLAQLNTPHVPRGQMRCLVQGYVRDRTTHAITSLGETMLDTLTEGKPSYKVTLPATTLEQPGIYRLQVLVTLQGTPAIPAYFEVPVLPVV